MADLPGGAQIPVIFKPGQPLTATDLNEVQKALLALLLTHDHSGNDQAAPQGVTVGADGIADNAIKGQHISANAVTKGDIHNGAVGASEIAEKCVGGNHLVDGAVGTAQIKDKAVTMSKLADEVLALLNTPREGATTYAYAAFLGGLVAYPTDTGRWFDWLVEPTAPVRLHDLPIRRLRDDGGWQPIRTILPPDSIKQIIPTVDMTTRAEMAASLASIFKQNEAVVRDVVGTPVTEVKTEGSGWVITLGDGQKRILSDSDMREMLSRVGSVGGDLSRLYSPLRSSSSLSLNTAFEKLVIDSTSTMRMASAQPEGESLTAQPMAENVLQPITYLPPGNFTTKPYYKIPIDPILFLDPTPADDHLERTRVAMLVDPQTIGWQIAQEGVTFFQPGVGGNAAFTDNGQAIQFSQDRKPSKEELVVISRILYHFDLEDDERLTIGNLLTIPKVYDFLNNPHLMATGYWTGAARNIRSIVRMRVQGSEFVRVRFSTAYTSASYVVSVTPDYKPDGTAFAPVTAHVLRRRSDLVDLLFLQNSEPATRVNFSIAIHGELVQT